MKKTLFKRMIIGMLGFCAAVCLAGYLISAWVLPDYYKNQQRQILLECTNEAAQQIDDGGDMSVVIDAFDNEYGVALHYANAAKGIFSGQNTHGMLGRQNVYASMTQDKVGTFFETTSAKGTNKWLSYLTQLNDGALLLGRVSYASMNRITETFRQFFIYVGFAVAAAFVIFACVFSARVSRPLKQLSNTAAKMGKSDFSLRYNSRRTDEIGQIGTVLNSLMTQLESAKLHDDEKTGTLEKYPLNSHYSQASADKAPSIDE